MSEQDYKSAEEIAERLRIPLDEAQRLFDSWNHKMPEEPEDLAEYAKRAKDHEERMRGLNYSRATGEINEQEYQADAQQSRKENSVEHLLTGHDEGGQEIGNQPGNDTSDKDN